MIKEILSKCPRCSSSWEDRMPHYIKNVYGSGPPYINIYSDAGIIRCHSCYETSFHWGPSIKVTLNISDSNSIYFVIWDLILKKCYLSGLDYSNILEIPWLDFKVSKGRILNLMAYI